MNKRYPIITIMGHVDHGKTSILELLINKKIEIKKNEVNGITQTIKAYEGNTEFGKLVFIDTPGHDSFEQMRIISTKITDLIILVISSNECIQKQTLEIINYINKNNIPFIIVINKIDKGYKNIDKIKNDLINFKIINNYNDNNIIYFSVKNNIGIKDLLNKLKEKILNLNLNILLNKNNIIESYIIDTHLSVKEGIVLYTLIKNGKIKIGDFVIYNNEYNKIRLIKDEFKNNVNNTIESLPYYIYCLKYMPKFINKKIFITKNIKIAKDIIKKNKNLKFNDNIINNINNNKIDFSDIKYLNYIIKVDSYRSYQAIKKMIEDISNKNIKIINFSIGDININDINLSKLSKSKLIGFNIKITNKLLYIIKNNNIRFNIFYIIYDLLKLIENDIEILNNINNIENKYDSKSKILNIFEIDKHKTILGCIVLEGILYKNSNIKIIRKKDIVYNGNIESLRLSKNDVNYVNYNNECGLLIKGKHYIKKNDILISNKK